MPNNTPTTTPPPSRTNLWLLIVPLIILLVFGVWLWRDRHTEDLSNTTATTSCNAVSTLSNVSIDAARSAASQNVVVQYTLTNTVDTGLNCFILATVKDANGVQVGTWRRSFLHGTPGTFQENHQIGEIAYQPGETLELKIIAAEGNTDYID